MLLPISLSLFNVQEQERKDKQHYFFLSSEWDNFEKNKEWSLISWLPKYGGQSIALKLFEAL